MKSILLAAAAILAMPAIAQTTPPAQDPATPTDATAPAPTAPATDTMPAAPATMPADGTTTAAPPAGTAPMPTSGTMTMGPMASTPAPAPAASYPICSKTVTDSCRERNSRK